MVKCKCLEPYTSKFCDSCRKKIIKSSKRHNFKVNSNNPITHAIYGFNAVELRAYGESLWAFVELVDDDGSIWGWVDSDLKTNQLKYRDKITFTVDNIFGMYKY